MRFAIAIAAVLFACAQAPIRTPVPPGLELFTRHSRFVDAQISPGGSYLAAVTTEGGRRALVFVDLRTRAVASRFTPSPESVGAFHWVNDTHAVVEMLTEEGTLSAPVATGELYVIDAQTSKGQMIFGYRATRDAAFSFGAVLSRIRGDDRRVLIAAGNFRDTEPVLSVYRLDVSTGTRTLVTASPIPGAGFLADENGEPRIAAGSSRDVTPRWFYREPGGSWAELASIKGITRASSAEEFAAGDRTLYVVEPLQRGFGFYAVNVDSGERKLLSKNEWSPPRSVLTDRRTHRVLAVEYEPDVPVWDVIVPDHPLAKVLKGLLAAYPDGNVRIVSVTDDGARAVAFVYSDRDPGRFLLVDTATLSAEELAVTRPWVKPEAMAETSAFHIAASDGMWIHGYLTLPRAGSSPPPLVVIPHGGPHGVRDTWRSDAEAQMLAAQGFAVLKVNFRGSGGYGRSYLEAGYRRWGDRIVDDVIDATRYVVGKGKADPKRVCIYGGSFGAYAALQASILAPDLYRCAVGYSGIYDLVRLSGEGDISESGMGRGYLKRVLGEDEAQLRRFSPAFNADKVHAKVLLIHGKKDRRAPIEQAERLRDALEKAGNPPEWLVEPREGHGFYDEGARASAAARLIEFLRKNTN